MVMIYVVRCKRRRKKNYVATIKKNSKNSNRTRYDTVICYLRLVVFVQCQQRFLELRHHRKSLFVSTHAHLEGLPLSA